MKLPDWFDCEPAERYRTAHPNSSGPAPSRPAWQDYPKFIQDSSTILLVSTKDLLLPEIQNAADRLGYACQTLRISDSTMDAGKVYRMFVHAIKTIRPDFVLTVNHLGLDREGLIVKLLEQCRLPFASWCVDSPHLILNQYANTRSHWLSLFMWDADYLPVVRQAGFKRATYLPLGVDETIFSPGNTGESPLPPAFVSFVGNSMAIKTASVLERHRINGALLKNVDHLARVFEKSSHVNVRDLMAEQFPSLFSEFQTLTDEQAYGYETGVIWQATGNYRREMVKQLKPFNPVIVGDPGWQKVIGNGYTVHRELNYYQELPWFYNVSEVNFNATSRQMKGGLNQRVFDVPACRRVLLTDHTRQLENLMEPGKELLAYNDADEIGYWLNRVKSDPAYYHQVAENGYRRVLAEHTYTHRLTDLVETMRRHYREGT
ncbi:MAG: glycosyltransferase [Thermodesulfobacteriota bacterium]|nr:glycosyltransferase [Thermodesulfobacteriota bacterium]